MNSKSHAHYDLMDRTAKYTKNDDKKRENDCIRFEWCVANGETCLIQHILRQNEPIRQSTHKKGILSSISFLVSPPTQQMAHHLFTPKSFLLLSLPQPHSARIWKWNSRVKTEEKKTEAFLTKSRMSLKCIDTNSTIEIYTKKEECE